MESILIFDSLDDTNVKNMAKILDSSNMYVMVNTSAKEGAVSNNILGLIRKFTGTSPYRVHSNGGHLNIICNGSTYEIKILSNRGKTYFDNWRYDWGGSRATEYVYGNLIKYYSVLPRLCSKMMNL